MSLLSVAVVAIDVGVVVVAHRWWCSSMALLEAPYLHDLHMPSKLSLAH